MKLWRLLKAGWRHLNGDAAYARFCAHWASHHPGLEPPDRRSFHRGEVQRRWNGVRRCC